MELRAKLQIQFVIKAMKEVILPAVDPANKVAVEQGHLAIGQLSIVLQCLPLMYRFERDELSRFLALGASLREQAAGMHGSTDVLHALEEVMMSGAKILKNAQVENSDLEAINFLLREKIGLFVSAVYAANDAAAVSGVAKAIVDHSQGQLLRERALLVTQGWEDGANEIPTIETLLPVGRTISA